jgi:hypothetical protein
MSFPPQDLVSDNTDAGTTIDTVVGAEMVTQEAAPSFGDYAVDSVAAVTFFENPDLSATDFTDYEKELLQNVDMQPDFAGKYDVLTWGCGTQCQQGAIVDLKSGTIVRLPVSILGLQYRPDSTLLIANPYLNDYVGASENLPYREFWAFSEGEFKLVHTDQVILSQPE